MKLTSSASKSECLAAIDRLLATFEKRAQLHDSADRFVEDNYADLKRASLMSLPVPVELGGQGCDLQELSDVLRRMARACSSTALAFSMHLQTVAALAWHWRKHQAPVRSVLERVAKEQLAIATSNGSDWLAGSGLARRVRRGFKIDAVKRIISAIEASDLLATSAVYQDPVAGPTVLHFLVPVRSPEVTIERSWEAMGMRGTGSHNVTIRSLEVPDGCIVARRPQGVWHDLYHAAILVALPLIYSVYLGIAEAAQDAAIRSSRRRHSSNEFVNLVGKMATHLNLARLAIDDMLAASSQEASPHTTSRVFMARNLAADASISAVEAALEIAGAAAFMRGNPIERMFRDVQAARFHPGASPMQWDFTGRLLLELPSCDADRTQ
jgi:alkylation response protein AidB-like acyl-CoA dehydrogenase